MNVCKHEVLSLLPARRNKLQCRHCSLIITEDELGSGCCPECLEVHKVKRRDFATVIAADSSVTRYCCDHCGMIIDC